MQIVAGDIESGWLPLSGVGVETAWDPVNPYRELDSANKEAP